jgi:hypothetical protein
MEAGAARIKGVIAGAFSIGALTALGRASINYAAQFQDLADQFGISASEAEGFSRAIRNVGGSSEKATGILRMLQAYQEKIGDTRTLSQFVDSIQESYKATGDFGQILEIVGSKNAAVFSAALEGMNGGLQQFNNLAFNEFADGADRISEGLADISAQAQRTGAGLIYHIANGAKALASGLGALFSGGGMSGMMDYFEEQDKLYQERLTRRLRIFQATIKARAKVDLLELTDEEVRRLNEMGPNTSYTFRDSAFVGPMPREKEDAVQEIETAAKRIDDLQRIGARALGGGSSASKSEDHLKWIRATADKQLAALQEIARGGSKF